jgi:hypothetical protein
MLPGGEDWRLEEDLIELIGGRGCAREGDGCTTIY